MNVTKKVSTKFYLKWALILTLIGGIIIPSWVCSLVGLMLFLTYLFFEQMVIEEFESILKRTNDIKRERNHGQKYF